MKNNSWPEVSLGDHTNFLTGFPFKSANYVDDPSGIRLLRGDNIVQGALRWDNCKRWTSSEVEPFSKYSLEYNDVVLAMDRPWIEAGLKWAYIKESDLPCLLVQRVSRLRGKNGLLTNFIRYIISDINFTNYVKSVITGINIPHISGPQIQAYQFRLPPIKTQQKIASILSSYDDLIENNTRRIEILEQMAKLVYEEWFVKFRFPGHKNVKIISSELGEIPEGWEVKKLREILSHYIGGGWGNEQKQEKFTIGSYVIRGTDIPHLRNGVLDNVPYRFHKDSNFKSRKIEPFDIIIEVSGGSKDQPVGRSVLITKEVLRNFSDNVMCASFCKLLRLNNFISPYYVDQILQLLYDTREITKYQTQSTGISNFKFEFFIDDLGILIPPSKVLNEFHNLLDPIYKEICLLGSKNQNLRKTRDLLLPKLISGEIDVSDLDIHIRNEFQES